MRTTTTEIIISALTSAVFGLLLTQVFKIIPTDYTVLFMIALFFSLCYIFKFEAIKNLIPITSDFSNVLTILLLIIILYLGYFVYNLIFPSIPIFHDNKTSKTEVKILIMRFNNKNDRYDQKIGSQLRDRIIDLIQTQFSDSIKNYGIDTLIVEKSRHIISPTSGEALNIGKISKADFIIYGNITSVGGHNGTFEPWICITNEGLKKQLRKLEAFLGEEEEIQLPRSTFTKTKLYKQTENICLLLKAFTLIDIGMFTEGRRIIQSYENKTRLDLQ